MARLEVPWLLLQLTSFSVERQVLLAGAEYVCHIQGAVLTQPAA